MVIHFEGTATVDSYKVHFMHSATEEIIPGSMYLELTDDEQRDFVIHNLHDVIANAEDMNWDTITYNNEPL